MRWLKQLWEQLSKLFDMFKKKKKEKEDEKETSEYTDCIDLNELPGVKGIDTRGWKITSHLNVKPGGDRILIDWKSTQWPSIADNNGSVWCAFKANGTWSKAWRYDQVRHGQGTRDYPVNPPHPKSGKKYDTIPRSAEAMIIWISTPARDARRTVLERTAAAFVVF